MPAPTSTQLRLRGVSVSFGDRRVLTDISLTVAGEGAVGLIGENGSGKSTLLRVAAGLVEPDAGEVEGHAPGGGTPRVGLLHQEPPFAPTTTLAEAVGRATEHAREADAELTRTSAALAAAPHSDAAARAYANALEAAERLGVWQVESEIESMLDGLGLAGLPRHRATGEMSGGQQTRLALACVLLSRPDVLLLDEPTNHLDDRATAHLRTVLAGWRGPVLLTSHDRAFLDETVTALVDLDPAPTLHAAGESLVQDGVGSGIGVTRFTGTYSAYLAARRDARARWELRYRDEQAELRRLEAQVRDSHSVGHEGRPPRTEIGMAKKFYADRNAKVVSRRVDDARGRLERLRETQVVRPPHELVFAGMTAGGAAPERGDADVVTATLVTVEGRLAEISLRVGAGEKWLITGPNGAGKSTLLQLLAGQLAPTTGGLELAPGSRVGLLTQEVDLPDPFGRGPARSAARAYADIVGDTRAQAVPLGTFGLLAPRDENRPAAALSVGQRRRLALAALLADPPELLLLDEPTNHLSLALVTELEAAIPAYPGAVVVASHDRWLRRRWTGGVVTLDAPLGPRRTGPVTFRPRHAPAPSPPTRWAARHPEGVGQ